jgi:3-deoxy-D-manno-octulosonic-acid transferase
MLKALYNFAMVCLAIAWLPRLFKSKYKNSLKARLGLVLPQIDTTKPGQFVWVHAVSMGETKAAAAFVKELRRRRPEVRIAISTVTETGQEEAKRVIPEAEVYFFLPLDFSWNIQRIIKQLKPSALILVEGEFWYNLIDEVRRAGGSVALINGKISQRSSKRFAWIPWFTEPLFASFNALCVQTEEYRELFEAMGVSPHKLYVTGNLKFDMDIKELPEQERDVFANQLGLRKGDFIVVLGSSHEGEETALLDALTPLFKSIPALKIIIVPRHPERFPRVKEILHSKNLHFDTFSEGNPTGAPVLLIDAMGKLMQCFQLAHVGMVCGTFVPGIGGHNLFEPAACGLPVLFGPHTYKQKAYAEALIEAHAGIALPAEKVGEIVLQWYREPHLREAFGKAALELVQRSQGAAKKTVEILVAKSIA